jgi:hypothetical protein
VVHSCPSLTTALNAVPSAPQAREPAYDCPRTHERRSAIPLFNPRCPVKERERTWIEESIEWLRREFGVAPLNVPVILPTSEYFPPPFAGSDADVRALVRSVARYMGVQADVDVQFSEDLDEAENFRRLFPGGMGTFRSSGAAGAYTDADEDGLHVVTIDRSNVGEPARLLAVIAHELAHVRLFGERRMSPDRQDHEPLTDLATVYLGMGIFTANAAFSFGRISWSVIEPAGGWQSRRLGYMTEQMFGYALARYAVYRGELDPAWARYLDTNPRVYMKQGVRYLRHTDRLVDHHW